MQQKPLKVTEFTIKRVHTMLNGITMRKTQFVEGLQKLLDCSSEQARWLMMDMMDSGDLKIDVELQVAIGNGESEMWP